LASASGPALRLKRACRRLQLSGPPVRSPGHPGHPLTWPRRRATWWSVAGDGSVSGGHWSVS